MARGFHRSTSTPRSFEQIGMGRTSPIHGIFVGFVKDTDDKARMGRIRVWIPELGGEPTDQDSWYQCNYASPFAGASSLKNSTPGGDWTQSQTSYGFWFVPPDIDNEVLVCFANGDPGRGYWFACLYQWGMNHMVPGIPGNNTTAATPPVVEYNKKNSNINVQSPDRPIFTPLYQGLQNHGVDKDPIRGTSDSGARRDNPINMVYGILTPGQNQFVMEDNPANPFIRLRTRTGAQILINDGDGSVYMNGGGGKNWVNMNSGGTMEIFGYQNLNIRSAGTINMRADSDLNLEAGRNINMKARNDSNTIIPTGNSVSMGNGIPVTGSTTGGLILMYGQGDVNISSGADMFVRADRDFHRTAKRDLYDLSYGNVNTIGHVNVFTTSGGNIYVTAPNNVLIAGSVIHLNGPPVPPAIPAGDATAPTDNIMRDNNVVADANFKFINRNTILSVMPFHEPYEYHSSALLGLTGHVTSNSDPGTNPSAVDPSTGLPLPLGASAPNQTSPTNLVGTPSAGMQPGNYTGQGYSANGTPQYQFTGSNSSLASASSFTISGSAIQWLKNFSEGFETTPYPDAIELKTIGVGHQLNKNELAANAVFIGGQSIPLPGPLTNAQVDQLLRQDLTVFEKTVQQAVKVQITQSQYDALVTFAFSLGPAGFRKSSVLTNLNAGNFDAAANSLLLYVYAGNKKLDHLVHIRHSQYNAFRGTTSGLQPA